MPKTAGTIVKLTFLYPQHMAITKHPKSIG